MLSAVLSRDLRFRVAVLAARFSSDRTALDALLRREDLPEGWFQLRERRWRAGFLRDDDADRRARRARLVAVSRQFELVGTQTWVTASAMPAASVEDAQNFLEHAWEYPAFDRTALTQADAEVSPPPAAGEHARAFLLNTTYETGPRRTFFYVVWHDAQSMVFSIGLSAPTEYDLLDAMSTLVHLQRSLASRRVIGEAHLS